MNNETIQSNRLHAETAIVSFSCPVRLREALGELSARDDRSLSSWIRKALEAAVRRSRQYSAHEAATAKGGAA